MQFPCQSEFDFFAQCSPHLQPTGSKRSLKQTRWLKTTHPIGCTDFVPDIEYENVSFCYPESDQPVLKNIDVAIANQAKRSAFIGVTGSSKSTLINLLLRYYDVTGGRILVDGVDIRDLKRSDLRAKIGYVPQKIMLFSGTSPNNLLYADGCSTLDI